MVMLCVDVAVFDIVLGDRPRHVTFNTSSRNGRVLKIALDIVLATADAQPGTILLA